MRIFLVLLLISGASAQLVPAEPTDTTLWIHGDGAFSTFALTPQPVPDIATPSKPVAMTAHSLPCAPPPTPGLLKGAHHEWELRPTPDEVVYEDGRPRVQFWNGFATPVNASKLALTWYLESQWLGGDPTPNPNELPGVLPNVVVAAKVAEVPINQPAGPALTAGEVGPFIMSPTTTAPGVTYHNVGGRHVYEVHIEMPDFLWPGGTMESRMVAVIVSAFVENPACDGTMAGMVRPHSSVGLRPNLQLHVPEPLRIIHLEPTLRNDRVTIRAEVLGPFGPVFIGPFETWNLTVTGPTEADFEPNLGNFHHYGRAVQGIWNWGLPDEAGGRYDIRLQVTGLQGGITEGHVWFEIGSETTSWCTMEDGVSVCTERGPEAVSQATPLPVGLAVLALVAAILRRNQ